MDCYRKVTHQCCITLKERRSEFIALATPAGTIEEATALITKVSKEHNSATHNCWAFRVGFPDVQSLSNDDGEPSGTAGRPILGEVIKRDLQDVALVVTRYFGGVKLGTRGLIDAYSAAAAQALDGCGTALCQVVRPLTLHASYDTFQPLQAALRRLGLEEYVTPSFGQAVDLSILVPLSRVEELTQWATSYDVTQWLLSKPVWQNHTERIFKD